MKIIAARVDDMRPNDFMIHRPNGRDDYLFVLFKSTSKVMVNGEYTDTPYGSFMIFDKHSIQSYFGCGSEDFCHDFMHFDFDGEYENLLFSELPKDTLILAKNSDGITSILSQIKNEHQSPVSKYRTEVLTNLGHAFLYKIMNEAERASEGEKYGEYFNGLYNLRLNIYKAPGVSRSIDTMSREMNLSRSYFQSLYKNIFGVSCNNDIINARVAYAKTLLSGTSMSINEIAVQCGYNNTEHFIRQFKLKVGQTPLKFRNK